jgi:hypothetical protein
MNRPIYVGEERVHVEHLKYLEFHGGQLKIHAYDEDVDVFSWLQTTSRI